MHIIKKFGEYTPVLQQMINENIDNKDNKQAYHLIHYPSFNCTAIP